MDTLCQRWWRARSCINNQGGACHNSHETYDVSLLTSSGCPDASTCAGAACRIDEHFISQINAKISAGEYTYTYASDEQCTNTSPSDPSSWPDSCCGTAPAVTAFRSSSQQCNDGQLSATGVYKPRLYSIF